MVKSKNRSYLPYALIFGSFVVLFLAFQTAPWAKKFFVLVCHQDPLRSFTNETGIPYAVCSRCFGFYSMLAFNWILLMTVYPKLRKGEVLFLLLFCWGLNLLDVLLNQIQYWQNTSISRFFGGMLIAFPIAFLFYSEFFSLTSKKIDNPL